MDNEQRESRRFEPKKNSFAALGGGCTLVGNIKDISSSGLSFEHIAHLQQRHSDKNEIDIFIPGTDFYLADVPCVKVYDIPLNPENSVDSYFIPKRCGVQFEALKAQQIEALEYFLENYTSP